MNSFPQQFELFRTQWQQYNNTRKNQKKSTSMFFPSTSPQNIKNFKSHISKLSKAQHQHKFTLSKYQSSSTLQRNPNTNISFPKAIRFPQIKQKDNITSFILLPSTISSINSNLNFGFGSKDYLPKHVKLNALQNPGPTAYLNHDDLSNDEYMKNAKTFGLSYEYYRKNFVPGDRTQNIELNKKLPGPGKYNLDRELGDLNIRNNRRINLKLKGKTLDYIDEEIMKDQSPKKYYLPNTNLTKNLRYMGIGFGYGTKYDFTLTPVREYPGPGQYEMKPGKLMEAKRIRYKKKYA